MSKDLKFKVKVIAISLKGNKIAKAGEEVAESQLATDAKVLLKGGYITHTKASKAAFAAAEKAVKDTEAKAKKEAKDKAAAEAKAKKEAK